MLEKIKKYVDYYHMLSPGDIVVAGVSGGADSVCLLFVLLELQKEIPFRLFVVHVNHCIRKEAPEDAAYVERLCRERDIPFYLVEKNVEEIARRERISTEEAGRKARYEAFRQALHRQGASAAQGRGKIAVAHNSRDRAETMLFHLFRGTGLTGLCGIRPVRGNIIRPLLCVDRTQIEAFLEKRHISYCIDSTNEEDTYTRNKIRRHILPYAEREIAGGAVSHMGRTGDILLETEDFVQQSVRKAYNQCVTREAEGSLRLCIREAVLQHKLIQKELLLKCAKQAAGTGRDISGVHVRDMLALLEREGSRSLCLPQNVCVRREYGDLIFEKRRENRETEPGEWIIYPENGYSVEVPELGILDFRIIKYENSLKFPENQYTKWFDYDKMKKLLKLRRRQPGDYLTVNERLSRKSVQDYMVNEKIPRPLRDRIWLLADGSHVVWVIGYRISQAYKIDERTKRILQVQVRGGHDSWQSM